MNKLENTLISTAKLGLQVLKSNAVSKDTINQTELLLSQSLTDEALTKCIGKEVISNE